jgi:fumarate hydratase class II
MNNNIKRIEKDTMGEIAVPIDKYWGAQTERSRLNFEIGSELMPKEIIQALSIIKKAAASTNENFGILNHKKAELIMKVCDEILLGELDDNFPLVIWQTGSGTQTNMNINEVIANRAHVLNGGKLDDTEKILHPNDDVNKSQSSNDVFPSASNIAAYTVLVNKTIPALKKLKEAIDTKSKEYENIIKTGRTHTMDAVPLTLGQEFSGYACQLDYNIKTIEQSLIHLAELPIGGTAVGTGLNAPKNFDIEICKKISEYTNLPFKPASNKFEGISTRDAIVAASAALKYTAVSLFHIANNIRFLASGPRCAIGEIILPANEPGSSIMPGKVNPTQTEALTMVCAQIIGNDLAINIGGMNGHFQLNTFMPMIINNFLKSANLMADACNSFCDKCVIGVKANINRIEMHLNNSLMMATALTPIIGYDKTCAIVKKAYEENITLKEATLLLGYLSAEDYDKLVNIKNMI